MKRSLVLLVVCIAFAALAEPPPLLVLNGKLVVLGGGQAPTDAQMSISATQAKTALEVKSSGAFELRATAARSYDLSIYTRGYAAIHRAIEVDDTGHANLGEVELIPLKKANLSVVVGRRMLAKAPVQQVALSDRDCATVRAADDSGCSVRFCANQEGAELEVSPAHGYVGHGTFHHVGRVALADALAANPKGAVVTTRNQDRVTLTAGLTYLFDSEDPYGAALHVNSEAPAADGAPGHR